MCKAGGPRCSGQGRMSVVAADSYNGQGRSDEEYDRIAREYAATDDNKTYEVVTAQGTRLVASGINSAKALAGKDGTFAEKRDAPPKTARSMAEQASLDRQARMEALVNQARNRLTTEAAGRRELPPGEQQN